MNLLAATLKQGIKIINGISRDTSKHTEGLKNAINPGSDKVPDILKSIF